MAEHAYQHARNLLSTGRADEAKSVLVRALLRAPRDVRLMLLAAEAALMTGDRARAAYFGRQAWDTGLLSPLDARTAAHVLAGADEIETLVGIFERNPPLVLDLPLYELVVKACLSRGFAQCAERVIHAANARLDNADVRAQSRLAVCLASTFLAMGLPEDGLHVVEDALRRELHPALLEHRAVLLNYVSDDPTVVASAHREYGRSVSRMVALDPEAMREFNRAPGRALHLGFLSADLRDHPVARFIHGFLQERSRDHFSVTCYATQGGADFMTAWMRANVEGWRDVTGLHPAEVRRRIIADGVDFLIELSGLFGGNALPVMAKRTAPIQMTMIGYPATTGIAGMDVRVVDSHTDPAGSEAYAVERLVRLDPCFLCYAPAEDSPPVTLREADAPLVFGSFNSIQKYSHRTVALFAGVLRATPASRLFLKCRGLADPRAREVILNALHAEGIDPSRIELLEWVSGTRSHLDKYSSVDVALDTFPYHGTTTTCEAMWMGVPVVTRVGRTHASRVGLSLLNAVGLRDLACGSDEEFTEVATALAHDSARRKELRSTLRARMAASPLCDAVAHTRRLETVIRSEWERVCAGARPA